MKRFKIDVLNSLIRTLLIFSIANTALLLFREKGAILMLFLTVISSVLFSISKEKIKNGIVFLLIHIGFFLGCWGLTSGKFKIILLIALFFQICYSMAERTKNKEVSGYSGLYTSLFVVEFFVGAYFKNTGIMTACLLEAVAFVGMKFLLDGMINTVTFIDINKKIADMPANLIKRRVLIFVLVFIGVVALGMLAGIKSGIGDAIDGLFYRLWQILEAYLEKKPIPSGKITDMKMTGAEMPDKSFFDSLNQGRNVAPWLNAMENVIIYTALFFIGIWVVKSVFLIFKGAIGSLYSEKSEEDVSEFLAPEGETIKIKVKKIFNLSDFSDSKYNDAKVRKLYKKYILKNKKEISQKLTPTEIAEALSLKNAEQITDIYEKAKYKKEELTKEDVAVFKGLIKEK